MRKLVIFLSVFLLFACEKSTYNSPPTSNNLFTGLPERGNFYEASILVDKNKRTLGGPEYDTLYTYTEECGGCTSNTFGASMEVWHYLPKMKMDSTVTYVIYYDTLLCTMNNTGSKRLNVTLTSSIYDSAYDTEIGRIWATTNTSVNQVSVPIGLVSDTIPLQTGYYYHIVVPYPQDSVYYPLLDRGPIYLTDVFISGTSKCSPFSPSTITSYNYTFNWSFTFKRYYYYSMP